MARIKADEIIEHLDSEMRSALEDAVNETIPNAKFDADELFRAFVRAVGSKTSLWERVPDRYIRTEEGDRD